MEIRLIPELKVFSLKLISKTVFNPVTFKYDRTRDIKENIMVNRLFISIKRLSVCSKLRFNIFLQVDICIYISLRYIKIKKNDL